MPVMANFFGLVDLRYRHYRTLQTMVIVGWIAPPLARGRIPHGMHGGDYSPVKGQQRVFGTRVATEYAFWRGEEVFITHG